jgi:hypothetical protein
MMFPDVNLIDDRTLLPEKPLTGRLKQLADIILRRLAAGETELSNPSLYEALGMAKGNFGKLVVRAVWKAFLDTNDLRPELLGNRTMGLRHRPV